MCRPAQVDCKQSIFLYLRQSRYLHSIYHLAGSSPSSSTLLPLATLAAKLGSFRSLTRPPLVNNTDLWLNDRRHKIREDLPKSSFIDSYYASAFKRIRFCFVFSVAAASNSNPEPTILFEFFRVIADKLAVMPVIAG